MHPKNIAIADYTYLLPEDKIAAFPLANRDASKLLVYKNNTIEQSTYQQLASFLPADSLLVFNDTRVIPARIIFQKPTGGFIEIFCLEPYEAVNEYSTIMGTTKTLRWKCMIGGVSKWKEGLLVKQVQHAGATTILNARLVQKLTDAYVVEFSWQPEQLSFAELIGQMGDIPLPPYIKRKPEDTDKDRYQTIYAAFDGSVAAPTAGLHFTPAIFSTLKEKNIQQAFVTLHVGAGTFKPVKAAEMDQHEMHAEWMEVAAATIKKMAVQQHITAVGTTSLRTMESLYWMGVKTILFPQITITELAIQQWDVYEAPLADTDFSTVDALLALVQWMDKNNLHHLVIKTQILIAPGYRFRVAKAIITNFHQPQSTLLLLVAAAIGNNWRSNYDYALANDFRFLSYGDGSLLFIDA